jgi:hypothetical protein
VLTVLELWRITHRPLAAESMKDDALEVATESAAEPIV